MLREIAPQVAPGDGIQAPTGTIQDEDAVWRHGLVRDAVHAPVAAAARDEGRAAIVPGTTAATC